MSLSHPQDQQLPSLSESLLLKPSNLHPKWGKQSKRNPHPDRGRHAGTQLYTKIIIIFSSRGRKTPVWCASTLTSFSCQVNNQFLHRHKFLGSQTKIFGTSPNKYALKWILTQGKFAILRLNQNFIWIFHAVGMEISNGFQMNLVTHFQETQHTEERDHHKCIYFTQVRLHHKSKCLVKWELTTV